MSDFWVRVYSSDPTYVYVNSRDLDNFRVVESYSTPSDWAIVAFHPTTGNDQTIAGGFSTAEEAHTVLKSLLHGQDLLP